MDLFETIKDRRSIRNFTDDPVEEKDLKKILEAANEAPSARNQQPWRFIVIKNKEVSQSIAGEVNKKLDLINEKAAEKNNQPLIDKVDHYRVPFTFFQRAPITVAVIMTPYQGTGLGKEVGVDSSAYRSDLQSASAAIQNFLLAAHALGYGSCWMTGPLIAHKEISSFLLCSNEEQLIALLPLGKYSMTPRRKDRKPFDELTSFIE